MTMRLIICFILMACFIAVCASHFLNKERPLGRGRHSQDSSSESESSSSESADRHYNHRMYRNRHADTRINRNRDRGKSTKLNTDSRSLPKFYCRYFQNAPRQYNTDNIRIPQKLQKYNGPLRSFKIHSVVCDYQPNGSYAATRPNVYKPSCNRDLPSLNKYFPNWNKYYSGMNAGLPTMNKASSNGAKDLFDCSKEQSTESKQLPIQNVDLYFTNKDSSNLKNGVSTEDGDRNDWYINLSDRDKSLQAYDKGTSNLPTEDTDSYDSNIDLSAENDSSLSGNKNSYEWTIDLPTADLNKKLPLRNEFLPYSKKNTLAQNENIPYGSVDSFEDEDSYPGNQDSSELNKDVTNANKNSNNLNKKLSNGIKDLPEQKRDLTAEDKDSYESNKDSPNKDKQTADWNKYFPTQNEASPNLNTDSYTEDNKLPNEYVDLPTEDGDAYNRDQDLSECNNDSPISNVDLLKHHENEDIDWNQDLPDQNRNSRLGDKDSYEQNIDSYTADLNEDSPTQNKILPYSNADSFAEENNLSDEYVDLPSENRGSNYGVQYLSKWNNNSPICDEVLPKESSTENEDIEWKQDLPGQYRNSRLGNKDAYEQNIDSLSEDSNEDSPSQNEISPYLNRDSSAEDNNSSHEYVDLPTEDRDSYDRDQDLSKWNNNSPIIEEDLSKESSNGNKDTDWSEDLPAESNESSQSNKNSPDKNSLVAVHIK